MTARPNPILESFQALGHVLGRVFASALTLAFVCSILGVVRTLGHSPLLPPVFETDPAWYLAFRQGVVMGSAAGVMLGALQGLFACAAYGTPARLLGAALAGAILGARGVRFHTPDLDWTLGAALVGAAFGIVAGEINFHRTAVHGSTDRTSAGTASRRATTRLQGT